MGVGGALHHDSGACGRQQNVEPVAARGSPRRLPQFLQDGEFRMSTDTQMPILDSANPLRKPLRDLIFLAGVWLIGFCQPMSVPVALGQSVYSGGTTFSDSRYPLGVMNPVQAIASPNSAGAICPRCGKIHGSAGSTVDGRPVTTATSRTTSTTGPGRSISPTTTGGVRNVIAALNAQRSRQGLASLSYDPSLQAVAERRARMMASTGNKNHPPGSFSPGTHEGVGWSSSYSPSGVSACFTSNPNMRSAGAAMATGRDGVYFCVVYR
ncbi:MAG: CAP domain-containing protein [Planctomycetota bacterium]